MKVDSLTCDTQVTQGIWFIHLPQQQQQMIRLKVGAKPVAGPDKYYTGQ